MQWADYYQSEPRWADYYQSAPQWADYYQSAPQWAGYYQPAPQWADYYQSAPLEPHCTLQNKLVWSAACFPKSGTLTSPADELQLEYSRVAGKCESRTCQSRYI